MITFAAIAPHPPILLPTVGSESDRDKVKNTITALERLAQALASSRPDMIIISSPHQDWGFDVPLHFLAPKFPGQITRILTSSGSPADHYQAGQDLAKGLDPDKRFALIASGDLSHCLKADGPYGFHPDGPAFDEQLIKYLRTKDIPALLDLDEDFPDAGECGLRSFSFLLGAIKASNQAWQPEILSYEGPFGVGYLVAKLQDINT